ncbi:hypothetical protein, partial [Roseibium aggregatum]|uniref:hypothetical protein n=1 Tax=Roseibium aggregatum TaxID=187304 RepID=UPI003A97C80D
VVLCALMRHHLSDTSGADDENSLFHVHEASYLFRDLPFAGKKMSPDQPFFADLTERPDRDASPALACPCCVD